MKFCRFILLAFFLVTISPLLSDVDKSEPPPQKESSGPKYFTDVPEDKPLYDENTFWGELINMFITLGFIIIILIALAWVMRRMQNTRIQYGNESSVIKLIDHRSLSAKSVVYLLHIHGRAVVVSESQSGMTRLADFPIDGDYEAPLTSTQSSRFENLIKNIPK